MEDDVGEDEVGKRPFDADVFEFGSILFVHLNAQRRAQYERSDGGQETGQKRIEWERSHEQTVGKLKDAGDQHISQIRVHQLETGGRLLNITSIEFGHDGSDCGRHVACLRLLSSLYFKLQTGFDKVSQSSVKRRKFNFGGHIRVGKSNDK